MTVDTKSEWHADPLIWGHGPSLFEVFLEPTCPFSKIAFGKLDDLLDRAGRDRITVRIWLHSQPWHLFSGIVTRSVIAASTAPEGKEAARKVLAAVFAAREEFEFEDHCSGPNLDTSPNQLIARMEAASGIDLVDRFRIAGLGRIVKQHTRYARQNGIHVSPSFMVDGLVNDRMSSGDSVDDWARMIGV